MKRFRSIKIITKPLSKKQGTYPKPYPLMKGTPDVLYPAPIIYGGKIFEVPGNVIE